MLFRSGGLHEIKADTGRVSRTVKSLEGQDILSFRFDRVGSAWVGTDQGLVRLNPYNGAVLGQIAGLPSSRVLALSVDTGNKLWVGTTEGLAWVSMSDYRSRIYRNLDR